MAAEPVVGPAAGMDQQHLPHRLTIGDCSMPPE
jgi:hypothetical protein